MSEKTYCDRCGMEITENRHLVGQGYIGFFTSSFEHQFDLCDGCYQSWSIWLPRSTDSEPAAKAALDARIESEKEAEEWVEIDGARAPLIRVARDGSDIQYRFGPREQWKPNDYGLTLASSLAAYRKGREVALAESAELREQVRELVEAVDRLKCGSCSIPFGILWYYGVPDVERVKAAAGRVQL